MKYNLWIYGKNSANHWWIETEDEYYEICEKRLRHLLKLGSHNTGYEACIFKIAEVGDESWIQDIPNSVYK